MSLTIDDAEIDLDIRSFLARQNNLLEHLILNTDPRGAVPVRLMANGSQQVAINDAGEILVSDGPYDLSTFNELADINTAYNFFGPRGREQFVITGFLMYGDKQVSGAANATVIIYESSQADSTTEDRVILQVEVGQNQSIPFPNIRILCNRGAYINAKTDDDDIHMTIFGHYVDLQGRGRTN
jgi:hypothetical protein